LLFILLLVNPQPSPEALPGFNAAARRAVKSFALGDVDETIRSGGKI
jgi:hypothetical protein